MEDVLSVYTRPHDPTHPVVCFDEMPKTLHAHSRPALPARLATEEHEGTPLREDYEYVRRGTANLFLWPARPRMGIRAACQSPAC